IWLFHRVSSNTHFLDLMAEGLSARILMEHRDAHKDLILRLCNRLIACSIVGRSRGPKKAPPRLPSPADARTMPQRMARLEEDVHEIRGALTKQREVIDAMACDFSRFYTWTTTSLARMMDRAGVTYMSYSQTLREYQRCVRRRTDSASTSTARIKPGRPHERNIDEYWWRI
nr:hypothetical protein [Tanacetum cinerariifolium]